MFSIIRVRLQFISHFSFARLHKNVSLKSTTDIIEILNKKYVVDDLTNVTPQVVSKVGANLHNQRYHPLNLVRCLIQEYFYLNYCNRISSPIFSIYDNLNPIVTVQQNFDSLLVPKDHISRRKSDCYYINSDYMLRAHTTAHQVELIKSGLDAFVVFGDAYRRDAIDHTHYPVFHQAEGVRIFSANELFGTTEGLSLFEENGTETNDKQRLHTMDASKLIEHQLKSCLEGLVSALFGHDCETRWVDAYFPFTHPSWELEILYKDEWLEAFGCGIIQQKILQNCGVGDRIGWAFGLGLDRLAMKLYSIPDIRILWSQDSGFLSQFKTDNIYKAITYKPVSIYPQCKNDISFWLSETFSPNDFYDLVRSVGGEMIEQVDLIDDFFHAGKQRHSQCYRITYRHTERTLTQDEVNYVHRRIEQTAVDKLGVEIR